MKSFRSALVTLALGVVVVSGEYAHAQIKDGIPASVGIPATAGIPSAAGIATVHAAPTSKIVTVSIKELRHGKHGKDVELLVAQAAGFRNDTCDVLTTFDVVKEYEKRQTWSNVRQRVDVTIDGKTYTAKFRDFGYYPLGLNLACIDFESPFVHAELQIPVLPLDLDAPAPSSLSYDAKEIAKSDPGTPFLNKQGEITAVLVSAPNGASEFASALDIQRFLKEAEEVSPWPKLQRRALSTI